MDENTLLSTLNPNPQIRDPAQNYLSAHETKPGFAISLLELYQTTQNSTAKLSALLYLKNVLMRQFHVVGSKSKPTPIPEPEKQRIKEILVDKLFFNPETDPTLSELFMISAGTVSQTHFYDQWPQLVELLVENVSNPTSDYLKLLNLILKVQMKKRLRQKRELFKQLAEKLLPSLRFAWNNTHHLLLDKAILKIMTVLCDVELLSQMLAKAKQILYTEGGEDSLTAILKGFNFIDSSFPQVFSGEVLQQYMELNCKIIAELQASSPSQVSLLKQACNNIRDMIISNEESQKLIQPNKEWLLEKCLEQPSWASKWEEWTEDPNAFLEVSQEEDHFRKLINALLEVYPEMISHIPNLLQAVPSLPFPKSHAVCSLIGTVPKVAQNQLPVTLDQVLDQLGQVQLEGYQKSVALIDVLWIVRKWSAHITDYKKVYQVIKNIRSQGNVYVVYECCLTLKELLYQNLPEELCFSVLQEFSGDIFQLIKQVSMPQVVWHLVSLISALIDKTTHQKNPELLSAFQTCGLGEIIFSDSEMVTTALIDMFEGLVVVYSEDSLVIQACASFLGYHLPKSQSMSFYFLWHFVLANMEAVSENLPYVESLLEYLNPEDKKKGVCVKILEEYMLLYLYSNKPSKEVSEFIAKWVFPITRLTGNPEQDGVSMALLVGVSLVQEDLLYPYFCDIAKYLCIPRSDYYCTLCVLSSVFIVNRCVLQSLEFLSQVKIESWLEAMTCIMSPHHKKLNCAALLQALPYLSTNTMQQYSSLIYSCTVPYVENYSFSTQVPLQKHTTRKPTSSQMAPSNRRINIMASDSKVNSNLVVLFKVKLNELKARGVDFKNYLSQEEAQKFEELSQNLLARPASR